MFKRVILIFTVIATSTLCEAREELPSWDDHNASFDIHEKVAKSLTKQFGQCFLTSGGNMLTDPKDKVLWAFWAIDNRKLSLCEGIQLAAEMIRAMLDRAQKEPAYVRALQNIARNRPHEGISQEISPDQFGFRVAFWDANIERPLYPYLAQIKVSSTGVYFYYADPETQGLLEPVRIIPLQDLLNPNRFQLEANQFQCFNQIAIKCAEHLLRNSQ